MSKPCSCFSSPWRPSGRQSRHQTKPRLVAMGRGGERSQSLKWFPPTFSSSPFFFFCPTVASNFVQRLFLAPRTYTYVLGPYVHYITNRARSGLGSVTTREIRSPLLVHSLSPTAFPHQKATASSALKSDGSLILKIGLAHYIASEGGETFFLGTALSHLHLPPAFGRSFMKCIQRKIV